MKTLLIILLLSISNLAGASDKEAYARQQFNGCKDACFPDIVWDILPCSCGLQTENRIYVPIPMSLRKLENPRETRLVETKPVSSIYVKTSTSVEPDPPKDPPLQQFDKGYQLTIGREHYRIVLPENSELGVVRGSVSCTEGADPTHKALSVFRRNTVSVLSCWAVGTGASNRFATVYVMPRF